MDVAKVAERITKKLERDILDRYWIDECWRSICKTNKREIRLAWKTIIQKELKKQNEKAK